ncbi:MAG: translation initiation factor IF-2 [Bacteroidota bacterium]
MAGKPIRLGKAASELNIGVSTLIEFLESKGIKIDSNPNTKLEESQILLLRAEFASDVESNEQSKKLTEAGETKDTVIVKVTREELNYQEEADDEEDTPINLDEIKRSVLEPFSSVPKSKVNIVGNIDLRSVGHKAEPKVESDEAPRIDADKIHDTLTEDKNKESDSTENRENIETIRVERKVLSGPTVLGKIDLPIEKSKPSTPANSVEDQRKKRKRIKKVENSGSVDSRSSAYSKDSNKEKVEKQEIREVDIQKEIKETLARLSNQGGKSKASKNRRAKRDIVSQRRQEELEQAELEEKILKLTEFVTVSELASMMNVQPTQVISACMSLGIFASINQRIDAETIQIIADEFGFETQFVSAEISEAITVQEDTEDELLSRPPIITLMGHVDHGKTSLLDKIRNANVSEGEAGGITQHIGAYSVTLKDGRKMTFLDTPGHEAFTAMRARGAQVTDVAIIIVAADDDVMPQTKEAISHAQAAGVPMVFAINKIDKPGANSDKIREQLSGMNILVEDWGGKYQVQEISAKQNLNIDALLDKVLLEAEILDLKANPDKNAVGTVIESSLDKGKGYVTNLLVEAGTMRVGDIILVGRYYGKVRAMHDEHGRVVKEAGPSQPVSILGISGAPSAGDKFNILDDEKEARNIATKREQLYREQGLRTTKHITLDEIGRRLAIGDFKELNIIVKGDVDGSIEALSDALLKLSTEEIQVKIIHKGVGAISEADVNLASASDAIILGFQVRPTVTARKLAENEQIDIRLYSIIYKAIEEIKSAMEGMLSPDIEEKILGTAEIRETFNITKVGTIAGCFVIDGIIKRTSKIRIIRDGIVVHTGILGSLKRFKDDVKEVKNNYECGLNIEKFNDINIGDVIEAFEEVEVARKL